MSIQSDAVDEATAAEIARLTRLVTETLRAGGVERQLQTWLAQGLLSRAWPCGDARIAMIGASFAMQDEDLVFGTARDLPAALARGVTVETALRQALGADGDPALGRGLPGAVRDERTNVNLTDSSPASHLVHAAGFGHAAQLDGGDRVALGLFGSGAQGNGEVHAAFNFAALTHARVVFVARGPLGLELPMVEAAPAWGIKARAVNGRDGQAVWDAVVEARAAAVAGEGPTIIDARLESAEPVDGTPDVVRLQEIGGWSPQRAEVVARLKQELARAAEAARAAAGVPEDTLTRHLYAER